MKKISYDEHSDAIEINTDAILSSWGIPVEPTRPETLEDCMNRLADEFEANQEGK